MAGISESMFPSRKRPVVDENTENRSDEVTPPPAPQGTTGCEALDLRCPKESEPKRIKLGKEMACNQTAVAVLQELCMKRKWNPPMYEVTNQSGSANDPMFEVSVTLCDGIRGVGIGRQKKAAKHEAAKKALAQLQKRALPDVNSVAAATVVTAPINPHEDIGGINTVGELQNLCMIKKLTAPEYTVIGDEGEPHEKIFTYKCTVSQRSATGTARKKQTAKHLAAQNMLAILRRDLKSILDDIPNDPSVSSVYSQKGKEMQVSEDVKKRDLEVVEKYKILKAKAEDIPQVPLISPGTKFADYHNAYASQLEDLRNILDEPIIKTEKDSYKKLKMVCERLNFHVQVVSDDSNGKEYIVFVHVDSDPPIIQAGHDGDETRAIHMAAFNTLDFMKVMAS